MTSRSKSIDDVVMGSLAILRSNTSYVEPRIPKPFTSEELTKAINGFHNRIIKPARKIIRQESRKSNKKIRNGH